MLLGELTLADGETPRCTLKVDREMLHVQAIVEDLSCPVSSQPRLKLYEHRFRIPEGSHRIAKLQSLETSTYLCLKIYDIAFMLSKFSCNSLLFCLHWFWLGLRLRTEVGAHPREIWQADAGFVESFLCLFELVILKLQLTNQIANLEIHGSVLEQNIRQRVNTVNDFWNVLLFVKVYQLESEDVRKLDLVQVTEENSDVIGMFELKLWMPKDAYCPVRLQSLHNFRKSDSIPQSLL